MGWLAGVLAVVQVIERIVPIVERLLPVGSGVQKAEMVRDSAVAVATATLPGVNMQDPVVQAALQAKIDADVALRNLLQAQAEAAAGTPAP